MESGGSLSDVDRVPIRTLGDRLQKFPSVLLARRGGDPMRQCGHRASLQGKAVTSTKDSSFQYEAPIVPNVCIRETGTVRERFE